MQKNKPDYYNDLDKVYLKIWELLKIGLENRDLPFHIPVFICSDKSKSSGRIVVLRGVDEKEKKRPSNKRNVNKNRICLSTFLHHFAIKPVFSLLKVNILRFSKFFYNHFFKISAPFFKISKLIKRCSRWTEQNSIF